MDNCSVVGWTTSQCLSERGILGRIRISRPPAPPGFNGLSLTRIDGDPVSRGRDHAEETIRVRVRPGSQKQKIVRSALRTSVGSSAVMPKGDAPKIVDLNGLSTRVTKRPQKRARCIKDVYSSSRSVVADENRVAHLAEVRGSFRNAPRRVKRATDREMLGQSSVSIE